MLPNVTKGIDSKTFAYENSVMNNRSAKENNRGVNNHMSNKQSGNTPMSWFYFSFWHSVVHLVCVELRMFMLWKNNRVVNCPE